MEELNKQVVQHILAQTTYDSLPQQVKQLVGNSKHYNQIIIKYSLQHQLKWRGSLVAKICQDEKQYYLDLVQHSKTNFMLFPYHLQHIITKRLRITPFKYYLRMMQDVMESDKSYDTLPNFTAADGVRLLGIGRNQFIDIMNQCRIKSFLIWRTKKVMIQKLLPQEPQIIEFEHWWIVNRTHIENEDLKNLDDREKYIIETLKNQKPAGEFAKDALQSLHKKGLIFFEIPLNDDDQIIVPPLLEGFVMNRVIGDYFENLLYKIFVSLDERTTIQQLATILQIDIESVKQAIFLYILLGFAKKKNAPPLPKSQKEGGDLVHNSWIDTEVGVSEEDNISEVSQSSLLAKSDVALTFQNELKNNGIELSNSSKRTCFIFDTTITAFLMSNLAGGGFLKNHAVTLYEVGKLTDESMDEFLSELDKVGSASEGDAQRYFDHAIALRNTIRFLRYNKDSRVENSDGGLDLLRCERLETLESETLKRILANNYSLVVSMAPITMESSKTITSCIPIHHGPSIPEFNSAWFNLFIYYTCKVGPPTLLLPKGYRLRYLPENFQLYQTFLVTIWNHDPYTVALNNLLANINDALLISPVLLQAYCYEGEDPETLCVAFPLTPEELEVPEGDLDTTYTENTIHKHPAVRKLFFELKLQNSFGYIKLFKIYIPMLSKFFWVPLELRFGLPLFDVQFNHKICSRVQEQQLFTEFKLNKHSKQMRKLSLQLLDFIAERTCEKRLQLDPEHLPLPAILDTFQSIQYLEP